MTRVSERLVREHRDLEPGIRRIRDVADSLGRSGPERMREDLDGVAEFLVGELIPHAQAEEAGLYQVAALVLGSPDAMAGMSREHVEIGRLADQLDALRKQLSDGGAVDDRDVRRVLYGLHAIISLHQAKEEEIYLPLLDEHLSAEEASSMFGLMEEAERFAKSGEAPDQEL